MSAIPMGAPGCPDLARSTASMESARMQLASSRLVLIGFYVSGSKGGCGKEQFAIVRSGDPSLYGHAAGSGANFPLAADAWNARCCCLAAPTWVNSHAT